MLHTSGTGIFRSLCTGPTNSSAMSPAMSPTMSTASTNQLPPFAPIKIVMWVRCHRILTLIPLSYGVEVPEYIIGDNHPIAGPRRSYPSYCRISLTLPSARFHLLVHIRYCAIAKMSAPALCVASASPILPLCPLTAPPLLALMVVPLSNDRDNHKAWL